MMDTKNNGYIPNRLCCDSSCSGSLQHFGGRKKQYFGGHLSCLWTESTLSFSLSLQASHLITYLVGIVTTLETDAFLEFYKATLLQADRPGEEHTTCNIRQPFPETFSHTVKR